MKQGQGLNAWAVHPYPKYEWPQTPSPSPPRPRALSAVLQQVDDIFPRRSIYGVLDPRLLFLICHVLTLRNMAHQNSAARDVKKKVGLKQKAFNWCHQYLGGTWGKISQDEFSMEVLRWVRKLRHRLIGFRAHNPHWQFWVHAQFAPRKPNRYVEHMSLSKALHLTFETAHKCVLGKSFQVRTEYLSTHYGFCNCTIFPCAMSCIIDICHRHRKNSRWISVMI